MNTKLFWENVNKRMKYERAQRLQRQRKAGVKRDSKSSQVNSEQQLQVECLLQVLEEYVTSSSSEKDGNFCNDRLSEDIDIISIAVQKLKKDMEADVLISSSISSEKDDDDSPGVELAMKLIDDLAESLTFKENVEFGFSSQLQPKAQESDENKQYSDHLKRTTRKANSEKESSTSGTVISSASNAKDNSDENLTSVLLVSAKNAVVPPDETLHGNNGEQFKIADADERKVQTTERNDVADGLAAEPSVGNTSYLTNLGSVESSSVVPPGDLTPSPARQHKDSLRLQKNTLSTNRKRAEKSLVWGRKLIPRSQHHNILKPEEDTRKEKSKFSMKGDKVLKQAFSSLKKNSRQQPEEEGPFAAKSCVPLSQLS